MYLSLIRMYLRPPDLREYGVPVPEPNVEAALKVLATHHHQVDTAEVSKQTSKVVVYVQKFLEREWGREGERERVYISGLLYQTTCNLIQSICTCVIPRC